MNTPTPDSLTARLQTALDGRYRIESHAGQGGMATVYVARDIKHDRPVALKLLRPDISAVIGAERFLHEIRVAAHLQHPHLLPLFDSGEADGLLFYVMPYVEGESLRDRIRRERQLSIEDAVKIATQVAGALDYAHRQGVIHRDIKPENILLHDGQAMIADFGIALAVRVAGGTRITETGLSLGTPHYMSPEQASADRDLDGRTDIYALGAVLYEMLAGEPPHTGPSAQAVVAKLMTEDPKPLTQSRRTVPPHIDDAVMRALSKLPADRWQTAAEFANAIERGYATPVTAIRPATPMPSRRWATIAPWVVAGVGVAAAVATMVSRPPQHADPIVVSTLLPPPDWDFAEAESFGALSTDGRQFAFIGLGPRGQRQLWVRRLDTLVAQPVPETEGASAPFWSPDGSSVAYFVGDALMVTKVPAGTPHQICHIPNPYAGSWGMHDVIAVATGAGIVRANALGGACTLAIKSDTAKDGPRHPSLLPDGRHVLFTHERRENSISVGDLDTGAEQRVMAHAQDPTFVSPNILLFGRSAMEAGRLWAQRFDPTRFVVDGDVIAISEIVRTMNGVFAYAASPSGVLAYLPGLGDNGELVTDRRGVVIDTIAAHGAWTHQWAQAHPWVASGGGGALVRFDIGRPNLTAIRTGLAGEASFPVWSPGDSLIAYNSCDSGACGIHQTRLSDGRDSILITSTGSCCVWPSSWSRDGRFLILMHSDGITTQHGQIWTYDLKEHTQERLVTDRASVLEGSVSPDGRWLAYRSDELGTWEVFVRPFRQPGSGVRVSAAGGRSPRWRDDGRELFFQAPNGQVLVADVPQPSGPQFTFGTPRVLFASPGWTRHVFFDIGTSYDVSHDGQQFAFRMTATVPTAVLVQNWRSLVK
jgi:serine/threonine-protein kinase